MQIQDVVTTPRSPWQNAYIERLHGITSPRMPQSRDRPERRRTRSLRERLRHVLHALADDLEPREGLPHSRPVMPPTAGSIIAIPEVNGLTIATTAWLDCRNDCQAALRASTAKGR